MRTRKSAKLFFFISMYELEGLAVRKKIIIREKRVITK